MTLLARGGQHYRTYVTTLRGAGLGGLAKLEVTTSLGGLERNQRRLERRLVLLGAIALVVGVAGTALAAELVLRPLRRLRAVASSMADDEDLDRRVPPDDGPTEVRSLATSFNAMLARLGRSSAARERALASTRRFAADAGHELRAPLTTIEAVLDTVRAHPEPDPARRDAMLAAAEDQQRRLARHGGASAHVRVTLQPAATARGARLRVEDDGPGVPADDRERIFAPFARAAGTTAAGSGLGLALVRL